MGFPKEDEPAAWAQFWASRFGVVHLLAGFRSFVGLPSRPIFSLPPSSAGKPAASRTKITFILNERRGFPRRNTSHTICVKVHAELLWFYKFPAAISPLTTGRSHPRVGGIFQYSGTGEDMQKKIGWGCAVSAAVAVFAINLAADHAARHPESLVGRALISAYH